MKRCFKAACIRAESGLLFIIGPTDVDISERQISRNAFAGKPVVVLHESEIFYSASVIFGYAQSFYLTFR
jgi:hypothetical protein